ncbi:MAG TPA: UDP-N-acetylmuramate dehydrogenase [Rudaea sp.]|jgi:UDP-N-acetylmuramate dehydrogenase|uniref:UDP-N-acetylmuramate dehydrogenase n=1 Tax=Rudaea sp. TaxID=2136325 RepID=UPI002F93B3C7
MNDASQIKAIPGCTIYENASLLERTTFRVPASASMLIDVHDANALPALLESSIAQGENALILGEGSNVLFTRDWPGVVLALRTRGIGIIEEHDDAVLVRVAAGEHWNDFVHWSLDRGLFGLENLALIPGSVGATPIQNIGAYGTEVGEFVHAVAAWDRITRKSVRLARDACAFAYRDSLFKREPGRYLIMAVEFQLPRQRELRLDYSGVREELATMGVAQPDARAVARAITRLRTRKLPDPATTGNAGSFFKNPIVTQMQAQALKLSNPDLPLWPVSGAHAKLSAAWLIEACNFKGLREGYAGISSQHALVLINHGQATGAQIWGLAQRVQSAVLERFGTVLEPEPLVI